MGGPLPDEPIEGQHMGMTVRALGIAVTRARHHPGGLFLANIVAALLSLPIIALAIIIAALAHLAVLIPVTIALALGVLPNPAAAGLHYVVDQMVTDDLFYAGDQWIGLKDLWRYTLRVWLISLVVTVFIAANIAFYARSGFPLAFVLVFIWVYVLVLWLAAHLYIYPLILRQEERRAIPLYRNALTIAFGRPSATYTLLPIWLIILLAGTVTGLISVFLLGVAAAMQHALTGYLIATFERSAGST
jgi:uncharacterized membrane protein YesL